MPTRMRILFPALLLFAAACGGARPVAPSSSGAATPSPVATVAEVPAMSEPEQALLQASEKGDLAAVKALLDKGVNVNARDREGRQPLIEAAYWQHPDVVKLLIERAANVNARKVDGTTALTFAINLRNKEIEQILRKAGAKTDQEPAGDASKTDKEPASPAATKKK
ncbi:MAG: ankyrin repeat domain-containing protein [Pyrinomonadaceae bacterium]